MKNTNEIKLFSKNIRFGLFWIDPKVLAERRRVQ